MSGLLIDSQQAVVAQALRDFTGSTVIAGGISFVFNPDNWPIKVDQEPDTPDNVITVYGTLGRDDGRTQIDGELQEHHGIQVRIRSLDKTGFKIATQVAVVLDKMLNRGVTVSTSELGNNHYLLQSIDRTGNGVSNLGKEMAVTRRNLYTINAVVNVRMAG